MTTSGARGTPEVTRLKATARLLGSVLVRYVLVLVVMAALGYLLTKVADNVWPLTVEDDVNQELAQNRTDTWNDITLFTSGLGNTGVIVSLCAAAFVSIRLWLHRWREAFFVALSTIGQSLVFLSTTLLIDRERPDVPHLDDSPPTSSFPSGHTSAALALYGSLAIVMLKRMRPGWLRWPVAVPLFLLPIAVGLSRLYRGMHHPSDVIGALVNASLVITLTYRAVFQAPLPEGDGRRAAARPPRSRRTSPIA